MVDFLILGTLSTRISTGPFSITLENILTEVWVTRQTDITLDANMFTTFNGTCQNVIWNFGCGKE